MTDSASFAKAAFEALDSKKAIDPRVLNIGSISPIADYFVIATASNSNQLEAMQDAVDEAMTKAGATLRQVEGNRSSTWILMDYSDVIVHLFSEEDRLFYDLERVWKDGIEVDPRNLAE